MKTAANRIGRQGSAPHADGPRAEVVAPSPALRADLLAQARAVAKNTGVWPVDEHASEWLTATAAGTADPPVPGLRFEPEVLKVRIGPTAALYALRFAGTAEVIAPDSQTAAEALPVLFDALPAGTLVWARGLRSPVAAAALGLGMTPARRVLVLVRDHDRPVAQPRLPAGFRLRAFQIGTDESRWLELNQVAFAALPDQGGWRLDDLRARMAADWFDPTTFMVLEGPGSAMAGCVWAKIEAPDKRLTPQNAAHPGGEIYVLSVHPKYHGLGLGRALLMAGLVRIHAAGQQQAHLYVDTTNTSAGRLYSAAGFVPRERILAFAKARESRVGNSAQDTSARGPELALD